MTYLHKRIFVAAAFLAGALMTLAPPAGAQQPPDPKCVFKTVSGRVVAHDWVGSVLIIDTGGDELSLVVSKDTTFQKGTSQIYFADINQSDTVSVRYYDCGFAGLKAVEVTVISGGY